MTHRYLCFPLLALTACLTEISTFQPEPVEPFPLPPAMLPPGMETQGRYLLGAQVDGLPGEPGAHIAVKTMGTQNGAPVTVVFAGAASLEIAGTNAIATNVILPGVASGELHVTNTSVANGIARFTLRYRASNASGWVDPCAGGEAVPFYGRFTRTGLHENVAGQISFACEDGVAFKCTDWGYPAGSVRGSSGWDIHQACTRMARGDYCATGTPRTVEGTLIAIYDLVGVNPQPPYAFDGLSQWPPPVNDFYFEAGWKGESEPAVCLSKLRWNRFPIGDLCGGALPDPRLDVNVKACDDYPGGAEEVMAVTGAKLFNASRYSDIALHTWRHAADRVATIEGYLEDASTNETLHPYQPLHYEYEGTDGLLVRSLPASADPKQFDEVYLYANGTERVYATQAAFTQYLSATHTTVGWRGKVFKQQGTRQPLVLYRNNVTGDHVTTTRGAPGAGYQTLYTIGYIAPLEAPL